MADRYGRWHIDMADGTKKVDMAVIWQVIWQANIFNNHIYIASAISAISKSPNFLQNCKWKIGEKC